MCCIFKVLNFLLDEKVVSSTKVITVLYTYLSFGDCIVAPSFFFSAYLITKHDLSLQISPDVILP